MTADGCRPASGEIHRWGPALAGPGCLRVSCTPMKRAIAVLTTVHRYLGLVFCLIFVVWFASGIVMVYARMPEYGAAERLARLAPVDAASIRLTPAEALEKATLADAPARIRISMLRSRPVYRFFVQGEWVTVFGD